MTRWLVAVFGLFCCLRVQAQEIGNVAQLITLLRDRDRELSRMDISLTRTQGGGRDVEQYWNARTASAGALSSAMRAFIPVPGGAAPRRPGGSKMPERKEFYRLRRLPPGEFRLDLGTTAFGQSDDWTVSEWKAGKEWWWFQRGSEPHVYRRTDSAFSAAPSFAVGMGAPMAQQLDFERKLVLLQDWLSAADAEGRILSFEPQCEFEGEPCVRVTLVRPNHVGAPEPRIVDRVALLFSTKRGGAPVHFLCELGAKTDKGVEVGLITRGIEARWIDFVELRPKAWIPSGCRLTHFEDLATQPSPDKKEPGRRRFELLSDEYEVTARAPDQKDGTTLGIRLFDSGTIIQNDITGELHRLTGRTTVDGAELRERIE